MSIVSILLSGGALIAVILLYLALRSWFAATAALEQDTEEELSRVNFPIA